MSSNKSRNTTLTKSRTNKTMTFSVLNTARLPIIVSLGLLGASAMAQTLPEVRSPSGQGMANEMRDTTPPASLRGAQELPPPDRAQIEASLSDAGPIDGLMDRAAYDAFLASL